MERRWSKDDFDKGDEVSGLRTGGGFGRRGGGLRGFEPPKSTSGDAAPTLNRQGKSTTPVKPLENAERKPTYEVDRPFRREGDTPREFQNGNQRSRGLDKEELGRIADYNVQQMREGQVSPERTRQLSAEMPKMRDVSKFPESVRRQAEKMHADRVRRWEEERKATGEANQESFKGALEQGITDIDKRRSKSGTTSFRRGGKINSRDYGK